MSTSDVYDHVVIDHPDVNWLDIYVRVHKEKTMTGELIIEDKDGVVSSVPPTSVVPMPKEVVVFVNAETFLSMSEGKFRGPGEYHKNQYGMWTFPLTIPAAQVEAMREAVRS
jgi:hypothetical protein